MEFVILFLILIVLFVGESKRRIKKDNIGGIMMGGAYFGGDNNTEIENNTHITEQQAIELQVVQSPETTIESYFGG